MSLPSVRLQLQEQSARLEFDDGRIVALPVGPINLASSVLRHDPPTPVELERAIDFVENALAESRLSGIDRDLVVSDALLSVLPGLDAAGSVLARSEVEALFQKLASRSLGMPVSAGELPHGREVAAALLILRECMHHLAFDSVIAA